MIYFTSDLHFGHNNIIKYDERPFDSLEHMNQVLIDNWNSTVDQNDLIYCLGDFSLSWDFAQKVTPRLNGKKILIAGNHDCCHPYNKKSKQISFGNYKAIGWDDVKLQDQIEYQGKKIVLSHFPYRSEIHPDQRYDYLKPIDEGDILFHGHIHTMWKNNLSDNGTPMINVGTCMWDYRPVSIDTLMEIK